MQERIFGQDITLETRSEAHEGIDKNLRYKQSRNVFWRQERDI